MAIERKCPNCGKWNGEEDHCVNCGTLISPVLIEEAREVERERRRQSVPLTALDKFILGWKHHPFFLIRWIYYILYSIGLAFFAIASFFAWMAASPNG